MAKIPNFSVHEHINEYRLVGMYISAWLYVQDRDIMALYKEK